MDPLPLFDPVRFPISRALSRQFPPECRQPPVQPFSCPNHRRLIHPQPFRDLRRIRHPPATGIQKVRPVPVRPPEMSSLSASIALAVLLPLALRAPHARSPTHPAHSPAHSLRAIAVLSPFRASSPMSLSTSRIFPRLVTSWGAERSFSSISSNEFPNF